MVAISASERVQKNRAKGGPASSYREASRLGDVGLGIRSQAQSPSVSPGQRVRYSLSDGGATSESACLPCTSCIPTGLVRAFAEIAVLGFDRVAYFYAAPLAGICSADDRVPGTLFLSGLKLKSFCAQYVFQRPNR